MNFEILDFGDTAEWDAFVAESPQGTVFCDSRFLDATGARFETIAVAAEGRPEAAALVIFDGEQPVRAPAQYAVYQGVLFSDAVARLVGHRRIARSLELLTHLIEALAERHSRVSFCLHPSFEDIRSFSWFHHGQPELGQFTVDVQYTAILDLEGAGDREQSLSRARSARRQDYNRALRAGFAVEETHDVATLLHLYQATFTRQQLETSGKDLALVESIVRSAVGGGFGRLFACRAPDGDVASMALFLLDARTAYYLFGANDPAFRRSGASTLLLFEAIWRCQETGIRRVDVVGVNSPRRGDYKTSFGAALQSYFVVNWERPTAR